MKLKEAVNILQRFIRDPEARNEPTHLSEILNTAYQSISMFYYSALRSAFVAEATITGEPLTLEANVIKLEDDTYIHKASFTLPNDCVQVLSATVETGDLEWTYPIHICTPDAIPTLMHPDSFVWAENKFYGFIKGDTFEIYTTNYGILEQDEFPLSTIKLVYLKEPTKLNMEDEIPLPLSYVWAVIYWAWFLAEGAEAKQLAYQAYMAYMAGLEGKIEKDVTYDIHTAEKQYKVPEPPKQ